MKKLLFILFFVTLIVSCATKEQQLLKAVESENLKQVENLLKEGLDSNLILENGKTPLTLAVEKGKSKMISLLLDFDADVYKKDKLNETPITEAIKLQKIKLVKLLCKECKKDSFPKLSFDFLSKLNNKEILSLLKEKKIDFDIKNKNGESLIMYAAKNNNIKLVEFLANDKEKRIYEKDENGKTIFDVLDKKSELYNKLTIIKNTWPKVGTVAYVILRANGYYIPGKVRVTKRVSKNKIYFRLLDKSFILSQFYRFRKLGSFYHGKTYSAPEKYFFKNYDRANTAGYKRFKLEEGRKIFY